MTHSNRMNENESSYSQSSSTSSIPPFSYQPLHHHSSLLSECGSISSVKEDCHHSLTMCCLCSSTSSSSHHHNSLNDQLFAIDHRTDMTSPNDDRLEKCGSDCSLNKYDYATSGIQLDTNDRIRHHTSDESMMDDDSNNHTTKSYPILRFLRSVVPSFSLAKFSIVILLCATLFDMTVTNMSSTTDRSRGVSLGSAAIASVTETLSPILPFAGGLDLRRDDYWSMSDDSTWFGTLQSVITQVQEAFAAAKDDTIHHHGPINDTTNDASIVKKSPSSRISNSQSSSYDMIISASKPFVGLDVIAQLTLGDIGECFRYAIESSNPDYSDTSFFMKTQGSMTQSYLQQVIHSMQGAVDRSRGIYTLDWVRPNDNTVSDIVHNDSVDALKFSAAMRIFAEWRLLRQVPDGYKGFAIGMSLGHKDVVQNIIKMEESVHGYIEYQRSICNRENENMNVIDEHINDCVNVQTPTLRELLSYEIETGVHPINRLPHLKEKSAGMGLLWVQRQLAYQTQIFDNVLDMGSKYSSMKNAVGAAYMQVYDQYHGWAVQKIFNYSFQAAPEAEEILRHMNPHRLNELMKEQRQKIQSTSSNQNDTSSDDTHNNENPIEQFINHIGGEWDKLAFNVVRIFNKDVEPPMSLLVRGGSSNIGIDHTSIGSDASSQGIDDTYITNEMVKDAHVQIKAYLQTIKPLLSSLQILFKELNMEDPTRV